MNNLVDFINQQCPDVLKGRLVSCIDEGKIDKVEFTGNNGDVETFVERLIAKIEQDAPNDVVKDRMIDCVLDATMSQPSMPNKSHDDRIPDNCTISG